MPLSTGERVGIGGEGIEMRVRGVRVLRDLHVVPAGQFGVRGTVTLGDDEIYVLGFASGVSSDSRDRGPVKLDRLIGRAAAASCGPWSAAAISDRAALIASHRARDGRSTRRARAARKGPIGAVAPDRRG